MDVKVSEANDLVIQEGINGRVNIRDQKKDTNLISLERSDIITLKMGVYDPSKGVIYSSYEIRIDSLLELIEMFREGNYPAGSKITESSFQFQKDKNVEEKRIEIYDFTAQIISNGTVTLSDKKTHFERAYISRSGDNKVVFGVKSEYQDDWVVSIPISFSLLEKAIDLFYENSKEVPTRGVGIGKFQITRIGYWVKLVNSDTNECVHLTIYPEGVDISVIMKHLLDFDITVSPEAFQEFIEIALSMVREHMQK